ncbi:MAG: hypothetical protein WDO15_27450 [Bacteroidota bacterium]
MQLVAKSRLTEFKQEFSSMGSFGILNYVAKQAATAISEKNPIAVRNNIRRTFARSGVSYACIHVPRERYIDIRRETFAQAHQ